MIPYPNIRPEIFEFGPFVVRWYGLMYVIGYFVGYQVLKSRIRKGLFKVTYRQAEAFITYLIIGMLVGARLVYVFLYNWGDFSQNPVEIFYVWKGGLSFHGAALGMVAACILFGRSRKLSFYHMTDSLAIGATLGIFFGRVGNFINGELYGRKTDVPWAMIFPTDPDRLPRHPSQIYQGLTEGLLLFGILTLIQGRALKTGRFRYGLVGASFLVGYGVLRFFTEFTREPDPQLGFIWSFLSMGQILCLIMVAAGLFIFWHHRRIEPLVRPQAPTEEYLESTG